MHAVPKQLFQLRECIDLRLQRRLLAVRHRREPRLHRYDLVGAWEGLGRGKEVLGYEERPGPWARQGNPCVVSCPNL